MARMILESSGYTVLEAADVKDALRLCYENRFQNRFDVNRRDHAGMSGRILAEHVAVRGPDPWFTCLVTTDDAILRHGILEEDIVFLQNPFTRDSLLTKAREAVNTNLMAV